MLVWTESQIEIIDIKVYRKKDRMYDKYEVHVDASPEPTQKIVYSDNHASYVNRYWVISLPPFLVSNL